MTQAPEKSDTPLTDAMKPVPQNDPVLRAWDIYKQSADYANTRKWAKHDEHVDGSLWAAFYAGYFACAVDSTDPSAAESAQAPSAYKCECGRTQACSDVLCAWAGPDTQAPVAREVGTPRTDALATATIDPAVNYASAKLTNALNLCAELERETQSLSAQVEALKLARDQMESDLREIIGSCNVHFRAMCAAEERADRLQAELDARTK